MSEYDLVYGYMIHIAIEFMKTEFNLFGHMVSYWMVVVMGFIVTIVGLFLSGFLE